MDTCKKTSWTIKVFAPLCVAAIAILGLIKWYEIIRYWPYTAKATYYRSGKDTSSGEPFNKDAYTMAVGEGLKADTWYRVEFNGRVVFVYANDKIPAGKTKSSIPQVDLSEGAFARLAPLGRGTMEVSIREER